MFTGIISDLGAITILEELGADSSFGKRLTVSAPMGFLEDVALGESIAINGACMTVTSLAKPCFTVDVSAHSLAMTTGLDQPGPVNLEKALRAGDRLGGHIVSGHVDGIGQVLSLEPIGESFELMMSAPAPLARYLAYKGSITVNGVSLTVNRILDQSDGSVHLSINLIPHTVQNTTLHTLRAHSSVNLEIDLIARYVERMLHIDGSTGAGF